eukprot:9185149-Pyramimonas_sp.AAC.1
MSRVCPIRWTRNIASSSRAVICSAVAMYTGSLCATVPDGVQAGPVAGGEQRQHLPLPVVAQELEPEAGVADEEACDDCRRCLPPPSSPPWAVAGEVRAVVDEHAERAGVSKGLLRARTRKPRCDE